MELIQDLRRFIQQTLPTLKLVSQLMKSVDQWQISYARMMKHRATRENQDLSL